MSTDDASHLPDDAALKAAAAHWHHLCDAAAAVVAACTDSDEGPAADPAKVPGATPDAVAAMDQLRAAAGPDAQRKGMVLHEVDAAARQVSASLPVTLKDMVGSLLSTGGGAAEAALIGAVLMMNAALHDLDETLRALGDDPPTP